MGIELNLNKIKNIVDPKNVKIPYVKGTQVPSASRRPKAPSILIREVEPADNTYVNSLLYEHFRSLTIPAIMYWLVQHVYDLVAIVVINACLLSFYNLFYFCLLFLVYLFVRARYEIERHIKESCPDLVDVHKTYRNIEGSNFWVAYVSGDQLAEQEETDAKKEKATAKNEKGSGLNGQKGGNEVNDTNFTRTCQAYEILGCVGITSYRNRTDVGQMVRLVVTRKRRNMKVGTKLLEHLEKKALEMGYNEIRVYTNNLNTAYLQFLKQNTFKIIQIVRRGLMRGDLIVWSKVLKQTQYTRQEFSVAFGNASFIAE